MRYFHAGKAMWSLTNTLRAKRLHIDEMTDHMRRDLGFIDGHARYDATFANRDGRYRCLDLLTLTRVAS